MTNEEAIEHLKNINSRYPCSLDSTFRDECEQIALNLAIKALEKSPQGELANEVWQLYEKHQAHLATHVIEFGDDLKELLGKYQKNGG